MDAIVGGIIGALGASAVGGTATHFSARVQARRYASQNRLDQSTAAKTIEEAAAGAVDLIQSTTAAALSDAQGRLEDIHEELVATRAELAEARDELHQAIRDIHHRDETISQLRSEVERLRDRVRELEARIGGRRDGDARGPALGEVGERA